MVVMGEKYIVNSLIRGTSKQKDSMFDLNRCWS